MLESKNYITIDDLKLHYFDEGNGKKTLLFIHGFGLSLFSFMGLFKFFDRSKYRILALDLKGNGFSDKPKNSDYSISEQARIITELVDRIGVSEINLIGHSYGGLICLYIHYLNSKRLLKFSISSTVLINSPAYNDDFTPPFISVLKSKIGTFFFLRILPARILSNLLIRGTFYNKKKGLKNYLPLYIKLFSQKGYFYTMPQIAQQLIPVNSEEVIKSYKKIKSPLLIIWGEHDKVLNFKQAQKLSRDIENAKVVSIPETDHVPHEERPEAVYNMINKFYSDE